MRRKKLISCKIVDYTVLSYAVRRMKERKMFCSVHAKSFKYYKPLAFFHYTTQLIRRFNCLLRAATDFYQPHVL